MVPDLARAMARTIIFSLFFSLFCRFWIVVKIERIILFQIENLQIVTTLKFCVDYIESVCYFN